MMKGAGSLSTAELLAILLRAGTGGVNVIDVARGMLADADGSLVALSERSVDKFCNTLGVGPAKGVTLAACFELARRMQMEKEGGSPVYVRNASDAFRAVRGLFGAIGDHEECWCVFVRRNNRVISSLRISEGGETFTELNIKKIVRFALDCGATAVVLSHNHPSGNPRPSSADIMRTEQLRKALETFDLSLLDHIVIAEGCFYSFCEEEVIPAELNIFAHK